MKIKENSKYKILTSIRYLGDGLFYPFLSLYLTYVKLTEAKIGFILSLTPIIAILVNPIYALFCNNLKRTKNVLSIITIIEAFVIVGIGFTSNYYLLIALTILLALSGSAHYGLMDSFLTVFSQTNDISYSSIRKYGSMSYIFATAFGGYVIKIFNYDICFIFSALLFIISGFLYMWIKPIMVNEEIPKENKTKLYSKEIFKSVLINKKFIVFVIFYLIVNQTAFSADHFLSLYLETRGLTSSDYGLVFAYCVLMESVILIVLNKFFSKSNDEKLLIIASICFIIRISAYFFGLPIWITIVLTGLRGVSYAIILHVSFTYIVKIVGNRFATMAIMLLTCLGSIYLGIGDNLNGFMIENYSYKSMYFIVLIIAILGLGIAIFRYLKYKNSK